MEKGSNTINSINTENLKLGVNEFSQGTSGTDSISKQQNMGDVLADLGIDLLEPQTSDESDINPPAVVPQGITDVHSLLYNFNKDSDSVLIRSLDLKQGLTSFSSFIKTIGKDVFYRSVFFDIDVSLGMLSLFASDGLASGRRHIPYHEVNGRIVDLMNFGLDYKQVSSVVNYLGYICALERTSNSIKLIYSGGDSTLFSVMKLDNITTLMNIFDSFEPIPSSMITIPLATLISAVKFTRALVVGSLIPDLSKIFFTQDTVWSFSGKASSKFKLSSPLPFSTGLLLKDAESLIKFFDYADLKSNVTLSLSKNTLKASVAGYGDIIVSQIPTTPDVSILSPSSSPIATFSAQINALVHALVVALRTREVGTIDMTINPSAIDVSITDTKGGKFNSELPILSSSITNPIKIQIDLEAFIKLVTPLVDAKTESTIDFTLYPNIITLSFDNREVSQAIRQIN